MKILTTWLESDVTDFHRVVVLDVVGGITAVAGDIMSGILFDDLGLQEHTDYIFDSTVNSRVSAHDNRIVIRVKEEEHFIMLKLHYDSN